ncbi:adenine deaminase [Aquibacillus salsiterrae]|uniref:Adenine deaminase n=1 Tax=Aquibacillus salsiterrae TaxID=2950439 RepID=A0A9X3WEI0_9BACI|nr:adenine deaminase [Aquibacillus salsiterrae]MDC3418367.1 adenine deaminase [Aquibacillus salsiterrae]
MDLHQVNRHIMKVALGAIKADLVVKHGTIVNVLTGELIKDQDIAISKGWIAYIGNAEHTIGPSTEIINAEGKYISPGLIDGHMHVESTMLSVTEFSKVALIKGITSIMMDPHEIANVFGVEGVRLMHEEGQRLPLKVFTTFPSCVPATDDLEDAGASLDVAQIQEGLTWENVIGLGEVMNFPGVINGDAKMLGEIEATLKAKKTITGHFPDGTDQMLQAYIASGVTSCHETVTREQGLEKLRLGVYVMIREGSTWCDVKEVIKIVTEDKVRIDNILLVTDDVYPNTLVDKGHVNHVVRRAIEEGVRPIDAIQMATINVARYFNLDHDIGSIALGRKADLIIMKDLSKVEPETVISDGKVVVKKNKIIIDYPTFTYPPHILDSVKVGKTLNRDHFLLKSRANIGSTKVNVIKVIENSARTEKIQVELQVNDGIIQPDIANDIITLACIDRHHQSGQISLGFAKGFQLKGGAVASTVAHDSHNLLVMGTNETDMAFAANKLVETGGGMIVVKDGDVLGFVRMPIAGLMSDQPLEKVVKEVKRLDERWNELGCTMNAPFMTFSLIALTVIPDIRISNRGIVDVVEFKLI